jgi:MFS family permease
MADRPEAEYLTRGYTGRLFLGVSIAWFVLAFGRQLLPPLLPSIISDLGISSFRAGVALTGLLALRGLSHYPGGRLSDQLSRKTVLVGALATVSAGFVLLSVSTVYPLFVFAVMVIGTGAGAYVITARSTAADLYIEKRGQAFGLQNAFTNVAGVASAGGAVVVLAVGTWRSAFLPIVALFVLLAVALHRWNRDPYVIQRVEFDPFGTLRRVFSAPSVRKTVAAYVLGIFAWLGMINFLPTYLQVEKGLSVPIASAGFGLVFLVGAVTGPMAGVLGDRFGKLPTSIGALMLGILGLFSLISGTSLPVLAVTIVTMAVGFWAFFPVAQAYLMDSFADGTMGGDLGAVKGMWGLVGSLGPSYVGLIADWRSYTLAYVGLGGCLLASLVLVTAVWRAE